MSALREAGQAHTVAFLHGETRGQMRALIHRFMTAYGSPNVISQHSLDEQAARLAMFLTQGINGLPVYDLNQARYVMAFGGNLFDVFEEAGTVDVAVVRTGSTDGTVTINFSTSIVGSTATAGADYTTVTNQLVTFGHGESLKLVPVTILLAASDLCTDPNDLEILCAVSSNQADDTGGNGQWTGDVDGHDGYSAPVDVTLQNTGPGLYTATLNLRAERDPNVMTGRTYSITVSVMDASGNIGQASTTVVVPHNGKKK